MCPTSCRMQTGNLSGQRPPHKFGRRNQFYKYPVDSTWSNFGDCKLNRRFNWDTNWRFHLWLLWAARCIWNSSKGCLIFNIGYQLNSLTPRTVNHSVDRPSSNTCFRSMFLSEEAFGYFPWWAGSLISQTCEYRSRPFHHLAKLTRSLGQSKREMHRLTLPSWPNLIFASSFWVVHVASSSI